MNNKVVFGQYYNANSYLHRLDPRVKLIGLIILMVCAFLINNVYVLGGYFLLSVCVALSTKVPFGRYLKSLKMVLFIFIFTSVFQIFFNTEGTHLVKLDLELNFLNLAISIALLALYLFSKKVLRKGKLLQLLLIIAVIFSLQYFLKGYGIIKAYELNIFENGVFSALRIILRIVTLLFYSTILTLTTKPTELNNGLDYLLKPLRFIGNTQIFTMMISIALRFIPTLINETDKILKAQASRGVDFKEGNIKEKVMQIVSLLIPIFSLSYSKADDLAYAMEARGYDPDSIRTSINVLKFTYKDLIISIIILLILAITILGVIFYGI